VRSPGTRFWSVGWKLAGSTVAVIALLAVVAQIVLSRRERESLMSSKQTAADMLIGLSAAGLSAPLVFGDDKGVQEQVNLLAANADIVYGAAWPTSLEDPDLLGERLGELKRGTATVGKPTHIPRSIRRTWGDLLIEEAPVFDPNGKIIGVVAIAFSLEKERAALAAGEKRTLAISVTAASLLACLLLLIARRSIVTPLRTLAAAARRWERGESAPIEVSANDEIGHLAGALKSMSEAIAQRERSLNARNRDMRLILDNAGEGFLTAMADGTLSDEQSRMLGEWFSSPGEGATLFDYFAMIAGADTAEWMRLGWESIGEGFLPIEVAVEQLPKRFENGGRFFAVEYRPITSSSDAFEAMLIVVRDVTAEVERRRSEQMQKEALSLFQHFLKDRNRFAEFFQECRALVKSLLPESETDDLEVCRNIHTLKGTAGMFELDSSAHFCHELESRLHDEHGVPSPHDVETLVALWRGIEEMVARLGVEGEPRIIIDPAEHRTLLEAIRTGAPQSELEAIVSALTYEPAARRLASIGDQVKALGQRSGKPEIQVTVKPTPLRLPPRRWAAFWPALAHVLRNAVDHGLETPAERVMLGKRGGGTITMSLEAIDREVVFSFSDDGRGIDWEEIGKKAAQLGIGGATRQHLEELLYSGSLSTSGQVTELSGRGIGMSAMRATVQSLGGRVSISSEEGRGTTVRFAFPATMLEEETA
jgi:signal transduction histidine kinase